MGLRRLGLFRGGWGAEQLASSNNVGGTIIFRKHPVVPDAVKALGQHVDEEAADELVGRKRHRLVAGTAVEPRVLIPEGDASLVGGSQPAIGDRCAVGVAG